MRLPDGDFTRHLAVFMEPKFSPSPDQFSEHAKSGNLIPVWVELAADYMTPLAAYQNVREGGNSFLFESAEMTEHAGRFSFLGSNPKAILTGNGKAVTILQDGHEEVREVEDPLAEVEGYMAQFNPAEVEGAPPFFGGAVGYLSYDMVRFFEPTIGTPPPDELGLPDMVFLIADTAIIFDHKFRKLMVVANAFTDDHSNAAEAYAAAQEKIRKLVAQLEEPLPVKLLPAFSEAGAISAIPKSNTTREEYEKMVDDAKEFIRAGDIFQVVPSQRFEVNYTGAPVDLYRALRHVNPSPYMFCLEFDSGFSLVGSSPEVHVRSIEGKVEIRPIAGTRRRGKDQAEDDALADELLADPKERAEHIMLVDLARNDVGRIAEYKSVEVTEFMVIERYSHVMHITSNVVGKLAGGRSAYDVMRATFPAGTVSGSPKVRAMQIINDFEKSKRCAYSGAVGYFGFDGNLDSCIALRTCVLKDGKAYVQAGAGVVADSVPASEYEETVNKASGMVRAIEGAQRAAEQ